MALSAKPETEYSQGRYSRGVCFRLSFKWAALSLVGGEFNLAKDSTGLNVDSTKRKHADYRTVSAVKEQDPNYDFTNQQTFDGYVDEDGREATRYINSWGVRFKGSKASGHTLYNGISVQARMEETLSHYFARVPAASTQSLVYGYYGTKALKPAGHAVAFSKGKFFDANSGVWLCNPPSAAGTDIDGYVAQTYALWPRKFVIFLLKLKI
jgi:hypothetical protein